MLQHGQFGGKPRVRRFAAGVEGPDLLPVLRAGEAAGQGHEGFFLLRQLHSVVVPDHVAVDAVPGVCVLIAPVQEALVEVRQGLPRIVRRPQGKDAVIVRPGGVEELPLLLTPVLQGGGVPVPYLVILRLLPKNSMSPEGS